ncbi:MAG: T9SS type A sorting domain-containing protein, partial [Elusimicrobiota bacterium]
SEVYAVLFDTGTATAGIKLSSSTITLTRPNGTLSSGTVTLNGDNLILTLPSAESTNGMYKITVIPVDNANNIGLTYTSTFTIKIITAEEIFKESVYSYPNPSKSGIVKFHYTLQNAADVTVRIYDIMGELIYEEKFTSTAGTNLSYQWNALNQSNNPVASGVYICKIIAEEQLPYKGKFSITKKQIVIKTK